MSKILVGYDPAGNPNHEASWRFISDAYHTRVVGQSGVGKSTLFENLFLHLISMGAGGAFVDPHGDSVKSVASNCSETRIRDIVYMDPTDDVVIGLSPFEGVDPDLEVGDLEDKINKVWEGSVGPATEETLTNFSLAGFETLGRTFTVVHLQRMLLDPPYREWIFSQVKRPDLKLYFKDFNKRPGKAAAEADRDRKTTPSKNKLANITASFMREVMAHPKPFDFRTAIDTQKVILVNLRRGQVGARRARMYGAQVLEKIIKALYSREDLPKWKRTPFYIVIDEAPIFADLIDMQGLLAELRKYGARVLFGAQTEDVLDQSTIALLEGNCRTNICFNVAQRDAERFAKKFSDQFPESKILALGAGEFVMQTMNEKGIMQEPRLVRGFPPPNAKGGERRFDAVLRTSHANHGIPREQLKEIINGIFEGDYSSRESDGPTRQVRGSAPKRDRRASSRARGNQPAT